jgi:hypothetical protein
MEYISLYVHGAQGKLGEISSNNIREISTTTNILKLKICRTYPEYAT